MFVKRMRRKEERKEREEGGRERVREWQRERGREGGEGENNLKSKKGRKKFSKIHQRQDHSEEREVVRPSQGNGSQSISKGRRKF